MMHGPSSSATDCAHPHAAWPATGRSLFAIAAVLICAALALPAQAQGIFPVSGVRVDVTAETAAQARTRALAEGQRTALDRLFARLTMPEDRARLPNVGEDTLTSLVQGLEIAGERTSPVRYLASLTVRFHAEGVRQLLRDAEVPYADTSAPPQVVVPIYRSPATPMLWDDPNPWRDAWGEVAPEEGLIPIIVPFGELADISTLTAEQAVEGDRARLQALAERYDATEVLVAEAVLHLDPRGLVPSLEVRAGYHREDGYDQVFSDRFAGETVDDLPATLAAAVAAVRAAVDAPWKRDHLIMAGPEQVLEAEVPFDRIEEWVQVRQRLEATAAVTRSDVMTLGRSGARVRLHFMGTTDQLQRSLDQRRLSLISMGRAPGGLSPGGGIGGVGVPPAGGAAALDPLPDVAGRSAEFGQWRLELAATPARAPSTPVFPGVQEEEIDQEPVRLNRVEEVDAMSGTEARPAL